MSFEYDGRIYSNVALPKTKAQDILFGGIDIYPWDIITVGKTRRMIQSAYSRGKWYVILYSVPRSKAVLDDPDKLDYWMDNHLIGVYPELKRK